MPDLVERVEQNIRTHKLLRDGERFVVAVSGGADSMALLHVLHELAASHRWQLAVAHFNHRLRGRASNGDEAFVRGAAGKLGLKFVSDREDVRELARERGISIEMAARLVRHNFLAEAATAQKAKTVALAHHADDQVELFFLRLLRGAGTEGLAGMKWSGSSLASLTVRLVRPLLNLPKHELVEFLREQRIRFREDASNEAIDIQRNRVRRVLLPLVRRSLQPALNRTVLRAMQLIGEESEFVLEASQSWRRDPRVPFEELHPAVQRRVIVYELFEARVVPDFELVEQLRSSANKRITVGVETVVWRDESGRIRKRRPSAKEFSENELRVALADRRGTVEFGGCRFDWTQSDRRGRNVSRRAGALAGVEYFDAAKIGLEVVLRHWRPGDRFQPIGMSKAVKLQDQLTNAKIPAERRRRLVVATTASGEIFWVEGLRIGERFKLDNETHKRFKWRWRRTGWT